MAKKTYDQFLSEAAVGGGVICSLGTGDIPLIVRVDNQATFKALVKISQFWDDSAGRDTIFDVPKTGNKHMKLPKSYTKLLTKPVMTIADVKAVDQKIKNDTKHIEDDYDDEAGRLFDDSMKRFGVWLNKF